MDRLTIPDKKVEGGTRRTIIDARAVRKEAMKIYWALKKYEDTGLTPQEIVDGKLLTGWIPMKERLPDDREVVLVSDGEYVYLVEYDADLDAPFGDMDGIIAWMSLPKPYKEDQP